jgi:hypothetical protein
VIGRVRAASRPRALVAAALMAATLAGCGGQAVEVREAGAYADRVNGVQTRFEADLTALNAAADAADDRADVRRAVQRLSDRIAGVQRELTLIRPPAPVADAHRSLIAAFGRWRAPLDAFRRALRERDPRATQRAKTAFSTETGAVEQQVNAAALRINAELRRLAD